jgi:hypothetical protein
MSLQPLFDKKKFVVTAEVGPLKGTDTTELMEAVELLKGRLDAANVTDQQSSVMRLGVWVRWRSATCLRPGGWSRYCR